MKFLLRSAEDGEYQPILRQLTAKVLINAVSTGKVKYWEPSYR
jgi:hypothetical protein